MDLPYQAEERALIEQRTADRRSRRARRRRRLAAVALAGAALGTLVHVSLGRDGTTAVLIADSYVDADGDGRHDPAGTGPAEPGVGDVTFEVLDAESRIVARGTTDTTGRTILGRIPAGTYLVTTTPPPRGLARTPQGVGSVGSARRMRLEGTVVLGQGFVRPGAFCQDNPLIVTACLRGGDRPLAAILGVPLAATADVDGNPGGRWSTPRVVTEQRQEDIQAARRPPARTLATTLDVGSLFGLAYARATDTLYAGAYLRRHARFGTLGPSAIYSVEHPLSDQPNVRPWLDLSAIYGPGAAGVDPRGRRNDLKDDHEAVGEIGKVGFGDLEIGPDESRLWAVNFGDRRVYAIPTSGPRTRATIHRYDVPRPGTCEPDDVRPMALGFDTGGVLHLGAVCSGETSARRTDLRLYVFRFANDVFTTVLDVPIDYPHPGGWQVWDNRTEWDTHPSPMLATIAFDGADMILGIRDRYGDQMPGRHLRADEEPVARAHGDVLRACAADGGGFVLERGARCGGLSTKGSSGGHGPGGKSFYFGDQPADGKPTAAWDASFGSVTQLAGYGDVLTTAYDPVYRDSDGHRYYRGLYHGGIQRLSNRTGDIVGAYNAYVASDPETFGKTNGLGDLEAICTGAPIVLGDAVWDDLDFDGIQGADEPGLAGVLVELVGDEGLVARATTDQDGRYAFDLRPSRRYTVVVRLDQHALRGRVPTRTTPGKKGRNSDGRWLNDRVEVPIEPTAPGVSDDGVDFGFVRLAGR